MRKFFQKYIYWLICTVFLAAVALYGFRNTENTVPAKPEMITAVRFCVESGDGTEAVSVYEADDGSCYVFLPSYADPAQIKVVTAPGHTVSLGGIRLVSDMDCGNFVLETEYEFVIDDRVTTLRFYQSANAATLYINTVSGSMENIHREKNYVETASAALYTADGMLDYTDNRCTVNSRGNTTWDYDKKPYALTLSADGNLLGMGTAANWVLLANATDESNLHNKLVLDLANRIDPQLAPECRYVDLYLNGEYSGLYLLTEKVEVGGSRVDIDPNSGDFLCKIDLGSRWGTLRNPFKTQSGRTVEVCAPKSLQETGMNRIRSLVNEMEQAILSGADSDPAVMIDVDSWVHKYLIDEISGNIDSDLTSSYFYYADGIFYAGPVWDYDMTFGTSYRNSNPQTFLAKNAYKSANYASPYYSALYENKAFYSRMTEIYETEYLPLLEQLIHTDIEKLSDTIAAAAKMNSLRWRGMFDEQYELGTIKPSTIDSVIGYLDARVAFLNSAWIDNTDYCTVQFESAQNSAYLNESVVQGSRLETNLVDVKNTVWYNTDSGEVFDFTQPITEDVILTKYSVSSEVTAPEETVTTRDIVTILSIGMLVFLFLCLAIADIRLRSKERRKADERSGTHVSP